MKNVFEATGKTVEEALDAVCAAAGVSLTQVEDENIEVLEHGSKGFLGIGSKDAKVRLTVVTPDPEPVKPAPSPVQPPEGAAPPAEKGVPVKRPEKMEKPERAIRPERPEKVERNERGERERKAVTPLTPEQVIAASQAALDFLAKIFEKLQVEPEHSVSYEDDVLLIAFAGANLGALIGRRGETLNALQYLTNLAINKTSGQHIRLVLDVEGYRKGREETLMNLAKKMADKAVRTGRRVELEPMNPHERRIVHLALQNDSRVETLSRGDEPYRRVIINSKKGSRNKK